MSNQYFIINLRVYLDKDQPTYIGEHSLYKLLSDFSCPGNPDVEFFLLHNAIEFTKKDQSITYLVFSESDAALVGYFSLAIKPISICAANISKQNNGKETCSCQYSKSKNKLLYYCCLFNCSIRQKLFSA